MESEIKIEKEVLGMNIPKIDLRDHTLADIPEKVILSAIQAGVQVVGFSYPARTSFSMQAGMDEASVTGFRRTVSSLSEQYKGKIAVLLGEERDFYADPEYMPCDYIVGSVHYVVADDGAVCPLDLGTERILSDVQAHFRGNKNLLIRRYFETIALLVRRTRANYVANFDLLQKYNAGNQLFDPASSSYRAAVLDAMESLVREDVSFGICMQKGEKGAGNHFSPSPDIVRWLAAHGARFCILSGSSQAEDVFRCIGFAKSCGIGGLSYFINGGWKTFSIN